MNAGLSAYGQCLCFVLLPAASVMASEGSEKVTLFTGDLGNIFWTLLTFALVVGGLGKFAWRPILDALQRREDFIRDSLKQAKRDREEAEARLKEYTLRLESARADATAIVEEGRRDAEVLKRKIEEDARTEATAIMDRAKREIEIATNTAVKELYSLSAFLVTEVASRLIRCEEWVRIEEKSVDTGIRARAIAGRGRTPAFEWGRGRAHADLRVLAGGDLERRLHPHERRSPAPLRAPRRGGAR